MTPGIPCKVCGGSGFSGRGTGYDDVCGECGGLKYFPLTSCYCTTDGRQWCEERSDILRCQDCPLREPQTSLCPRCKVNRIDRVLLGTEAEGHICGVCWTADGLGEPQTPRETIDAAVKLSDRLDDVLVGSDGMILIRGNDRDAIVAALRGLLLSRPSEESATLRDALQAIADTDQYPDHEDTAAELREIARTALSRPPRDDAPETATRLNKKPPFIVEGYGE